MGTMALPLRVSSQYMKLTTQPPPSAVVKNKCKYAFILPTYLHGMGRDNLTFTIFILPLPKYVPE